MRRWTPASDQVVGDFSVAPRAPSTSIPGSRRSTGPGSCSRLRSSRSAASVELAEPAVGDQPLVDGPHPAAEDRLDGDAERDGLAVHRAAGADDEVGVGDQALRVDRPLGDDQRLLPPRRSRPPAGPRSAGSAR